MTDFIIVGQGLAATALMHRFHQNGISFKVIGNPALSNCSLIAAGMWNPVVFKRMSKSWMAETLVPELAAFYTACENSLACKLLYPRPIVKPFAEEQEKTLWKKKAANELSEFLDKHFLQPQGSEFENIALKGEAGRVLQSGFVDVKTFLEKSAVFFKEHIIIETFNYSQLSITESKLSYKFLEAKNMVFCEGHLVKNNPYFNWVPLKPAKGETLTIDAPGVELREHIFNRNGFMLRLPNGQFKVGATYQWTNLDELPTEKGRQELSDKLKGLVETSYSILRYDAGVRPSSIDRRPVMGPHPEHKNLFIFNGLGTKGVMLVPYFSQKFVFCYLQNQDPGAEVNVLRFLPLYDAGKKNKT